MASPFGRGERNSKHFTGALSSGMSVWGKRSRGVDSELPKHGGDVRGRGRCSDRSRTKDGGGGIERLEGSKVNCYGQ
jgi:hypothetical protein